MKKSGKNSLKENSFIDDPLADDLSDLMGEADWKIAKFELTRPKTETITMRVSKELLKAIKSEAKKRGLDYTKYMRILMENHIRRQKAG